MTSLIFRTKIKGETLRHGKLKKLDGKEVRVTITEITSKDKKKWASLSTADLKGKLDKKIKA